MIRTILTVDKNNLTLLLPDDFLGKRIEVIAFVIDEARVKAVGVGQSRTFFEISLDTKGFKFNREEANER